MSKKKLGCKIVLYSTIVEALEVALLLDESEYIKKLHKEAIMLKTARNLWLDHMTKTGVYQ
jgi:hypothetical protein